MILRSTALALVWLAAAPQVEAQDLGRARPESVGLSSSGLAKATDALRAHVESGDIAGVVAAVARRGKVVYFECGYITSHFYLFREGGNKGSLRS